MKICESEIKNDSFGNCNSHSIADGDSACDSFTKDNRIKETDRTNYKGSDKIPRLYYAGGRMPRAGAGT